jgi:hypothetical protein
MNLTGKEFRTVIITFGFGNFDYNKKFRKFRRNN